MGKQIKTKIFFDEGREEKSNVFHFQLNEDTPIQDIEIRGRSVIMLHGIAYTIGMDFEELFEERQKLIEND